MLRSSLVLLLTFSLSLFAQEKNKFIGFAENKGQIIDQKGNPNPNVKFLLNSRGLNVQLRNNGFSYDVYETKKVPMTEADLRKRKNLNLDLKRNEDLPDYSLETVNHRVDIDFEDSNVGVVLEASGKSKDYDNYYTLKHAPEGVLMVHQFEKVTYKNLYPNVDVVFFVPADSTKVVEYNFIVRPGGKVGDIKMKFNGVKTALVDSKIKMETRFGVMEETLPLSWTEAGGARNEVTVGYKKISKNVYGFDFDESQVSGKTVVIDPVPVRLWGTYYGGTGNEFIFDMTTDNVNNVYISGRTSSLTNIATSGVYQSAIIVPFENYFIAKFNSDGVRAWGTYSLFSPSVIALDSNLNLYYSGEVLYHNNLATPGAYQSIKSSYKDTFLVKLTSSGVLEWATYYGGTDDENIGSISIDFTNNIYLVGSTKSPAVFSSAGSHQENLNGGYDGFIAKFNPLGQRLWGTYYGSSAADGLYSSVISDDGYLYIVGLGGASISNNITTLGSYLPSLGSGIGGGFILKFTLDGERVWGSYIGILQTPKKCEIKDTTLYILGQTTATTGVSTPGTFLQNPVILPNSSLFGATNSFMIAFDVQSEQKNWGTYYYERIRDFAVNDSHEIYLSGDTHLTSGITTPDGYLPIKNNYVKTYLVKFNNLGQRIWGTYYGGEFAEQGGFVEVDTVNDIYFYGLANGSTTGIATQNAHQSNLQSNPDSFLVKFRDCLSSVTVSSNSPVCLGGTVELTASGGTTYSWTGPNVFTSSLANPTIPIASAADNGEYFCTISGTGGCDDTKSVVVFVGDSVAPVLDVAALPTLTGDCNSLTIAVPTATDGCLGSVSATTTSPLTYTQVGTYTIVWNYTDGTNVSTQNQTVVINAQPLPSALSPQVFCKQDNATLNDVVVTGQNIKWYDALINGTSLLNATFLVNGTTYYVSQTINGCESERVPVVVTVYETAAPSGVAVQTFCDSQVLTLADFVVTGSDLLFYDGSVWGNLLPASTTLVNGITYYASQTLNGCESVSRLALTSDIISGVPANGYSELMCDDLGDGVETVDLSDYKNELISNSAVYDFSYYTSFAAADNGNVGAAIGDFSNYNLPFGLNTVYVRVVFNNSCYNVVALELTVVALPDVKMKDTYAVCENGFVTITADAGFDNYSWSTGATTQSIMVSQGGSYWVTVTKNTGTLTCSSTKNIMVEVSERAIITAIETVDWTSSENVITVYVDGSGDYEYSVDGLNFQSSNQFFGLPNGEYTVFINDIKGCGVAKKDVHLLMYPKYFTPNGDSYNDFWGIQFYQNELNLVVKIFDRYGKFIKQLNALDPVWDGTYNGQELPATDYWFTVIRQDGTEYKGHFSLKR